MIEALKSRHKTIGRPDSVLSPRTDEHRAEDVLRGSQPDRLGGGRQEFLHYTDRFLVEASKTLARVLHGIRLEHVKVDHELNIALPVTDRLRRDAALLRGFPARLPSRQKRRGLDLIRLQVVHGLKLLELP